MQTLEPIYIEYRCKGCWHSNVTTCDKSGTDAPCRHCGKPNLIPQSTPENIERALALLESHPELLGMPPSDYPTETEEVNPYAGTSSLTHEELPAPVGSIDYRGYQDASLGMRFLGFLIDSALFLFVGIAGVYVSYCLLMRGTETRAMNEGLRSLLVATQQGSALGLVLLAIAVLPATLFGFLQWILIAASGQTVAKKLLGMRIVTDDGRLPGFFRGVFLRSMIPAALGCIPFIGPFIPLIDPLVILFNGRKCMHDYAAGTRVVSL